MRTRREFLEMAGLAGAAAALPKLDWASESGHNAADLGGRGSLRAHAQAHGLLVGCAVMPQKFASEPDYANAVAQQANLLVAESCMKWAALRPAPDKYDFRAADELLGFAQAHGQKLRGHNLCWHEALPGWFASTVNKGNARRLLTEHIETVAGRYSGKIHSWDVVNEAVDVKSGRADGLRKTPWLEMIGPDYLDLAYRTARKADPHALLTYNDYSIEKDTPDDTAKRARVLQLVRDFQSRGVPIDAVGVQSHLTAGDPLPGSGLREFVRELRRMKLQVFATEMDVNDAKLPAAIPERDADVAKVYRHYADLMLGEPNVTALLTWGITDRYTWLDGPKRARADGQPQRCLPLDAEYRPTPSYFALRDALDARKRRA